MSRIIKFPAIYERITTPRTDEEILRDLNARFSGGSEPRTSASSPLAPPPPEPSAFTPASATIDRQPPARAGRPRRSEPAQPERARPLTPERAAAMARQAACQHAGHWFIIGKSKTPGRMRRRCGKCHLEQTVLDCNVTGSDYRQQVPRGRPGTRGEAK